MAPKRRRNNDTREENDAPVGYAQVLPVAQLADDFDGEALDGATYLALASRESAALPFVTRVDPPRAAPAPVVSSSKSKPPATAASTSLAAAGRHPALPRESWVVVFTAHFAAYKSSLSSRWPPTASDEDAANDEALPLPRAYDYDGWGAFVDGRPPPQEEEEMDEEEAMNCGGSGGSAEMDIEVEPREPLVGVLRRLNSHTILAVMEHLLPDGTLPGHRARWLFALLSVLPSTLDADELSTLRSIARQIATFVADRYRAAYSAGELQHVPVYPGFYSGDASAQREPVLGETGHKAENKTWTLGARWKRDMDSRPKSEVMRPQESNGSGGGGGADVDEEIARAWMVVFGIVAGWAQWDLVEEVERMVGKLPRPLTAVE